MKQDYLWVCAESIGKQVKDNPNQVEKWRVSKGYRIKEIDDMISLSRMRQEVRNLQRLFDLGVNVPKLYQIDYDQKVITMEYLKDYVSLKQILRESQVYLEDLGYQIGIQIGKIHQNGIIHGDLTSSNIMINIQNNLEDFKITIIDFGLSQVSKSQEH